MQRSDSTDRTHGSSARARRLPPRYVWIIVGICVAVSIGFQHPDIPESALANIVPFGMSVVAVVTLLVWVTLFSSFRPLVRWLPALTFVVGLSAFVVRWEIAGFSGAMKPSFQPRGAARPDQRLAQIDAQPETANVDLTATTSDDFPQFLGPERRAIVRGVELKTDWRANPPREVWRQPVGAAWSAFVTVNGFAVTMEQRGPNELVTCYDTRTGNFQWAHSIEAEHKTLLGGVGPRGTPTIDSGLVFALGATGILRCIDGSNGSLRWQLDLPGQYGVTPEEEQSNIAWGRSTSPLVVNDLVIVSVGGPRNGRKVSLAAFDKFNGELIWEGGDQQISYASPALAEICGSSQILVVNESSVAGHELETGKVLWEYPWPGQSNGQASTSQAVPVTGNRVFLSKGYGVGSELVQISLDVSGSWSSQQVWKKNVLRTKLTNVAVYQDHVYGLDDGILSCVELNSGRRCWKQGRYGHGQVLLVGDVLLVVSEEGEVLLIDATPSSHKELARIQALDAKTWNNPCLFGKYLLVRNAEEAVCYELPLREPAA